MSELRQRSPKDSDRKMKGGKASSQLQAPPVSRHEGRSRTPIVIYVAILIASAIFFISRSGPKRVAGSYALCSSEGKIYTVDEANPRVECVVVHQGRIADTGSVSEIRQRWGDKDRTGPARGPEISPASPREGIKIRYVKPGSAVVPGLADAHGHIIEYGLTMQLPLYGCQTIQEIIQRIKAYLDEHPEIKNDRSQWIIGFGWNQNLWSPDGEFPTSADLDADPELKGRLISLIRIDGHAEWVSSAVLKLMEPLPETIDGGNIVRDENGNATGVFVDNAKSLIPVPKPSPETIKRYFTTTMKDAVAHGLTAIHDAGTSPELIEFFKALADQTMIPIRLYVMGRLPTDDYWGPKIPRLINYGPGGRLNVRSVKLVSDGALGSWGAAMIEPYSDDPSTHGLLLTPPDVLAKNVAKFFEDGWQVNVHAIGDQANKNIIDIFEKELQSRNVSEVRPRIEHAQIMRLSDLDRMGKLGIIASVQPTHATSDMAYAELRIGSERIKGAYAYQTLLQKSPNHVLPIGSDFPIESIDPLKGFYAAVARLTPEGTSPHESGGWYPAEKLTRAQALKGMTYDAAYAAFAENEYGSLRKGLKADIVVFDKDIMTIPVSEVLSANVAATIVDGEVVYGQI